MVQLSVSFKTATSKTNLKHNNRTLNDKEKKEKAHSHIDFSKSEQNIYIKQEKIEDAYDKLFGEALQKYNAKQKRNDRKINNYLQKVKKDGNLDVQREFIVQIGDMEIFNKSDLASAEGAEQNRKLFGELLTDYVEKFQDRNPNLYVYNAVIHMDEASPHLHLNVIPVAEGYKRGLEVQPSFSRAMKNQGFESTGKHQYIDFRNGEVKELEKLLNSVGGERKEVGTNNFEDVNEYKDYQKEIANLKEEYQNYGKWNVELKQENENLEMKISSRKKELEELPDIFEEKNKIEKEIESFTFSKFKEKFFEFANKMNANSKRLRDVVIEEISLKVGNTFSNFSSENLWLQEIDRQHNSLENIDELSTCSNADEFYKQHQEEIENSIDETEVLFPVRSLFPKEEYTKKIPVVAYKKELSELTKDIEMGKFNISNELFKEKENYFDIN